jgi:hypothetical protein
MKLGISNLPVMVVSLYRWPNFPSSVHLHAAVPIKRQKLFDLCTRTDLVTGCDGMWQKGGSGTFKYRP